MTDIRSSATVFHKLTGIVVISALIAAAAAACASPEPTATPIPPTATPTATQAHPTNTPEPPSPTPLPPTPTPTTEPTATSTATPTATATTEPTSTHTPTPEPTATPTPEPVDLTLVGAPGAVGDCETADEFGAAFEAVIGGDTSESAFEVVSTCYDASALHEDLLRYFYQGGAAQAPVDECLMRVSEEVSTPAHAIPLLYAFTSEGATIEPASIDIAVKALGCLGPAALDFTGQGNLFGFAPSPGLAKGIACVADELDDATTVDYAASTFKALSGAELSADEALVFFDNLGPSASCGFLPSNLAPIAMQLNRDDAACMIDNVGSAPLVSFFNFAPEGPAHGLNIAALSPLLGALNECDIALDLTAGR